MMTTAEKNLIEGYQTISKLIRKCMFADNKTERITYGELLLKNLNKSKTSATKTVEIFDDLISKLTNAAKIIQEQNEWLDCLYIAMGNNKNEIVYAANTAKKVLEKYKEKRKE